MISHGEFLRIASRDDFLVYHIQHDETLADLSEQDQAILEYSHKLNFYPNKVTEADIEKLREVGLDDRAILDVVLVICMFNFMNRLADGLGIETYQPFLKRKEKADQRIEETMANGVN